MLSTHLFAISVAFRNIGCLSQYRLPSSIIPIVQPMSFRGEVLVVIMNNQADWEIVSTQHWYRVPSEQVQKLQQANQWQPKWLAFYQTKVFGAEAYAIRYYAEVKTIREVRRWELFPEEPKNSKSEHQYHKLELLPLQARSTPLCSKTLRRIAFIPTTWQRFNHAQDICELLCD
jgi:hypothetical protein